MSNKTTSPEPKSTSVKELEDFMGKVLTVQKSEIERSTKSSGTGRVVKNVPKKKK